MPIVYIWECTAATTKPGSEPTNEPKKFTVNLMVAPTVVVSSMGSPTLIAFTWVKGKSCETLFTSR